MATDVPVDISAHTKGTAGGEERARRHGREAGRKDPRAARTATDSTSIDAEAREPIDPRMPHMPPA